MDEKEARSMVDKMLESQRIAKVELGDRYEKQIGIAWSTIVFRAKEEKISALKSTTRLATEARDDGHENVARWYVSAFVDCWRP